MENDSGEIASVPVYVLLDEGSVIIPPSECRFIKPSQLPVDGNFFVLTKNKIWCHKQNNLVKGMVQVNEVGFLSDVDLSSHIQLKLPKIPGIIIARALRFFQVVYREFHSESELMLLYNVESGYDLWCPAQEVSHGSVDYKANSEIVDKSFKVVGTIHSHCDFSAFHSGTDVGDEVNRDGIHITIGNVNSEYFSMVCSLVVNGERCQAPCEDVILGCKQHDEYFSVLEDLSSYIDQIEKEWHQKVSKKSFMGGMRIGKRKQKRGAKFFL